MSLNIDREIAALKRLAVPQLRARYADLFHEGTATKNKGWLIKRIAWRLQALAEGDLSERARQRAAELAHDADLRLSPPKTKTRPVPARTMATNAWHRRRDPRLPLPGTILTRTFQGVLRQVEVLAHGFACEGQVYRSLSAVAQAITGQHVNGYAFFRLGPEHHP
ncbi:MAG TPA: DUF2924 domain-containing protein [Gemmataceae bacterium]|nr:DUF2924 domain-containing protein [Gemmataceae bacterium]